MSQNVAEFVCKHLSERGVSRVYGSPRDGVVGLDVALEKARDFVHCVQARREELAAFMTSAHVFGLGLQTRNACAALPKVPR